MRLSTPVSRRNVRLNASAENVVASTAIPAMPGTMTLRSCWLPCRIAPKKPRNSSGSRKLKNAADGLRQNSRRSRRYWRQASASALGDRTVPVAGAAAVAVLLACIRRQLQVDLFERRPRDFELGQALPTAQRLARQLVQQLGRLVGDVLDEIAVGVAI